MSKRRQRAEIRLTAVSGEDLEVGQNVVWERPFRDKSGSEYDAGRLTDEENGDRLLFGSDWDLRYFVNTEKRRN